jgi:hypothetical protein
VDAVGDVASGGDVDDSPDFSDTEEVDGEENGHGIVQLVVFVG